MPDEPELHGFNPAAWPTESDRQDRKSSGPDPLQNAIQIEPQQVGWRQASGKVICLGEHAAVYGKHVIACPLPLRTFAQVGEQASGVGLRIPAWGVEQSVAPGAPGFAGALAVLLGRLQLSDQSMAVRVEAGVPRSMGLGASAALAVAVIRALDARFQLGLDDETVNRLAHECENVAHGRASGIDNTVATYGQLICYRQSDGAIQMEALAPSQPIRAVLGLSGDTSSTLTSVRSVRRAVERDRRYGRLIDEIGELTLDARAALLKGDAQRLGDLADICHGLLSALRLSTPDLEKMIGIAREAGATGAKVTGGAGGGAMLAICPNPEEMPGYSAGIARALRAHGYPALEISIG